ncbi:hypothetical protein J1614_000758 [Plenodomus biglobosus]|nr:hypothetical protein J1614_000758 [Plenodomus biglobosus]
MDLGLHCVSKSSLSVGDLNVDQYSPNYRSMPPTSLLTYPSKIGAREQSRYLSTSNPPLSSSTPSFPSATPVPIALPSTFVPSGYIGLLPSSTNTTKAGSIGTLPKNSTPNSLAMTSPPPLLNTLVHSEQFGQTKPAMFSMTPRTLIPVFLQKLSSFLTSEIEMAWGVVTMTAPARKGRLVVVGDVVERGGGGVDVVFLSSVSRSEMCSSLVPGGVSTRR